MKNVVHKLLLEFAQDLEDNLSKLEVSILKNLNRKGFTPKTRRSEILGFLTDQLGLDSQESMEIYFLFLHNYSSTGDYENLESPRRTKFDMYSKKVKSPNYTARDLVKAKIPFEGSNTRGEWRQNVYVVTSYNWYPIFVYKNNQWYENSQGYSMSTKKQMRQLRPDYDTIKVSKKELEDLIYK